MKDTVFQQIMKPISKKLVEECVRRYDCDYNCENFLTMTHLQTMVYAHLIEAKSLRTLEMAINSQKIGIENEIKRSTLSDANQRRPAESFLWILNNLISLLPRKVHQDLNKIVKILDSSPIQLKGRGYDEWTKEYATQRCQGLKLHVEYDLAIESPTKIKLSHPNYNDLNAGRDWPIVSDTIYVFDKGYYDFNWWWQIHEKGAFFITRLKKNVSIIMENTNVVDSKSILEDGTFIFKNSHPRGGKRNLYKHNLRRICVARENKPPLILVTNLQDVPAETIAELYKARWEIELFFKWIKQNLKLKKFLGKTSNAVKVQIITAIIAYILVYFFKEIKPVSDKLSLVLVWIRHNLQTKIHKAINYSPPRYHFTKQLSLNFKAAYL